MKRLFIIVICFTPFLLHAQPAGYYNGTEGKAGAELRSVLHDIINGHIDFSYSQAKYIINYSDSDPANEANVILFYTQRSQDANTYGTGDNDINCEHVWAKSHGNFEDKRPMDGDAFNLRPTDASVNILRGNLDFDECSSTGTEVTEAPGTYYTINRWEPSDAVKGQVARIIFYMTIRYEGTGGELDLEAVDAINTSPAPQHGKLSTLLQWNRDFPPSDFERRRNERIFRVQQNRNPFVDHPEFADLIWDNGIPAGIEFGDMDMTPSFPEGGETAEISVKITSGETLTGVTLFWGNAFDTEDYQVAMTASGDIYSGSIDLTGFPAMAYVHYKIVATDGTGENTIRGSYLVPQSISGGQITPTQSIQGTGSTSPLLSQIVTTTGIVVANFDNTFYIQSSTDPDHGLCIFGSNLTGHVGDSIVVTGEVMEYQNLTELGGVSYLYNFSAGTLFEPLELTVSQIGEEYEGMLVMIRNVQFAQGGSIIANGNNTFPFSDGTGTLSLFSRYDSRLVGHELPSGVVNLTGIVSQYGTSYQLLARDIHDITEGEDTSPPQIVNIQVLDSNWLMIDFNERLDPATSQVAANYTIDHGITVNGAYLYENTHVSLNITGMNSGTHTLTVNGVKDEKGNTAVNATGNFVYTATGLMDIREELFRIYPNPGDGRFTIEFHPVVEDAVTLEMYDITGKQVYDEQFRVTGGGKRDVGSTGLPAGIYLLSIHSGDQVYYRKVVVR